MIRILFLITVYCSLLGSMSSQTLWPGDINNNGKANGVDLLFAGAVIGESGDIRPNGSVLWTEQTLGTVWNDNIIGNLNQANADCDGDGDIDENDISNAVIANSGLIHTPNGATIVADNYQEGIQFVDPPLEIHADVLTASEGDSINFSIRLGNSNLPISQFYGITAKFSYTSYLVENNADFLFELKPNAWIDNNGNNSRKFIRKDNILGQGEFAITRIDKQNIFNGEGEIANLSIIIEEIIIAPLQIDTLKFRLEEVKLVDKDLNTYPIELTTAPEAQVIISIANRGGGSCPDIVEPVVGTDGNTYLNSCYAEYNGIDFYTEGIGFGDCIDGSQIDYEALQTVSQHYDPVCGCNGITYQNSQVADAKGVMEYFQGPCAAKNKNCYDPSIIFQTGNVEVETVSGILSMNCSADYEPVCGCNGVSYPNSCVAEASGIQIYSTGGCGTVCVDPSQIDLNANLSSINDPVCGCNGVTYQNGTYASAAGVLNYSSGSCGIFDEICQKAVPVQCGDFLPKETTTGQGNDKDTYLGCTNSTMLGPEKVYRINKTIAGPLQIGLEIVKPNLDLDLFVLAGECGALKCIGASTTNNVNSNNEGIIINNAAIGTYYIIVDGQYANSHGEYNLEVSCGYLDCSDAINLECGNSFSYNNSFGQDNVSLYSCSLNGGVLNVENNGPEVLHKFSLTESGNVDITLNGLSSNLELFLLDECNQSSCIDYSTNGGNSNEFIQTVLAAGTYYIAVDGYNGATSDYNLTVDCNSSCDFLMKLASTHSNCSQNTGSIKISTSGGTPGYIVSWSGTVSGNFSTSASNYTISNLPAGNYEVKVVDSNGCEVNKSIKVEDGGNLDYLISITNQNCDELGSVTIDVLHGIAPYSIYLDGPITGFTVYNGDHFRIVDLPDGDYTLHLVDAQGCSETKTFSIDNANSQLDFDATGIDATCTKLGKIKVDILAGVANYSIELSGPISGTAVTNLSSFYLNDLPEGNYQLTIIDANGCSETMEVEVGSAELTISTNVINGVCESLGSIEVSISNGAPNFMISWEGPVNGSMNTGENTNEIIDLPSGTYKIEVTDIYGCSDFQVVTLDNSNSSLSTTAEVIAESCGYGSVWVSIFDGAAPFIITWTGPSSAQAATNNSGFEIQNIIAGSYTISIEDENGCKSTHTITIDSSNENLGINLSNGSSSCNDLNSILVEIESTQAPFTIVWNSDDISGATVTSNQTYLIENLEVGTYEIEVKNANNCSITEIFELEQTGEIFSLNAQTKLGECGEKGWIEIQLEGGTPDYHISWMGESNGSQTISDETVKIENLDVGTYTIVAVDDTGCTKEVVVILGTPEPNIAYSVLVTDISCNAEGSLEIKISQGEAPFEIAWSGPNSGVASTSNNTFKISDLELGNYAVRVTDNNGCSKEIQTKITNSIDNLDVSATSKNGLCGENGSIIIIANGGTPPFNISWSGPESGSIIVNSNTHELTNLPEGQYNVKVEDQKGCSGTQIIQVSVSLDLTYEISKENAICTKAGRIIIDIITGSPGYSIIWKGENQIEESAVFNSGNITINDLAAGVYDLSITDFNNCSKNEKIFIEENSGDISIDVETFNSQCNSKGKIIISLEGGTPDYLVTWDGQQSGFQTFSSNTTTINNLAEGLYSITVMDKNGCEEFYDTSVIDLGNDLDFTSNAFDVSCTDAGRIDIVIQNGTPYYKIEWDSAQNSGEAIVHTNEYSITDLEEGDHQIRISDINGCEVNKIVQVGSTIKDIMVSFTLTPSYCGELGNIWVGMNNGIAPFEVIWESGLVSGSETTNQNSLDIENLEAGLYTVTVIDANGCKIIKKITLDGGPALEALISAQPGSCQNNTGQIQVKLTNGAATYKITWSGPVSGTISTVENIYDIFDLLTGDYSIFIQDALGCNYSETVHLENGGEQIAKFTFQQDNLKFSFNNASSQGAYLWNFGDNITSTETNPIHRFGNEGTYHVCLTMQNSCGSAQYCEDIIIEIHGDTPVLNIQNATGSSGEIVYLPVTLSNVAILTSLSGTLNSFSSSIGEIQGLNPGLIDPVFYDVNKTFSYFASNGTGTPITDGDILFYIAIKLDGSFGQSTVVTINDDALTVQISNPNGQILDFLVTSGLASISSSGYIQGEIKTYWGEYVKDVEVSLIGNEETLTVITDENGKYIFEDLIVGESYQVVPNKDINYRNGLSTFALFNGQRFILEMPTPKINSPYQIIAGDANCSNEFSTVDLFLIQQLIIGEKENFTNCPSWVFVNQEQEFPNPFDSYNVFPYFDNENLTLTNPRSVDFIGVKVGDILGSANPTKLKEKEGSRNSNLNLVIKDRSFNQGEFFEMEISSTNFNEIVAMQFTLDFDTDIVEFIDFSAPNNDISSLAIGTNYVNDGLLPMSWFSLIGEGQFLPSENYLIKLKFKAKENIESLHDVFKVSNKDINPIAHNASEETMAISLIFEKTTSVDKVGNKEVVVLYQNVPNPFNKFATIGFELPSSAQIELIIRNHIGQIVSHHIGKFDAGFNDIKVDTDQIGTGVFYYTLKTSDFQQTKKMICVK